MASSPKRHRRLARLEDAAFVVAQVIWFPLLERIGNHLYQKALARSKRY